MTGFGWWREPGKPEGGCPRPGRCAFRPRYDLSPANTNLSLRGCDIAKVLETTRTRTYVADVCQRCGKMVERPAPKAGEGAKP